MPPPSNASAATTSVQVALRIRPTTKQDTSSIPSRFQRTVIHAISNQVVAVDPSAQSQTAGNSGQGPAAATAAPGKKQTFAFDQVHGPDTSQFELFQSTAAPLISRFLEGFNCTILAYGQTSSGKTYSMTGVDLDADPANPYNGMGIIPRSISAIFSQAASLKDDRAGVWSYSIKGSFVELYNEELIDLLSYDDAAGGRREVQIREDKHGHIIWDGLREISVRNVNEVMGLIRQGTAIRRTNETDMNAQSSRSHAIFSLTLTQKKFTGAGPPPRSTTPVPPGGRSPSRLARPASSQYSTGSTRVSSPTFGRPPTPSFASAMGRGGGLRPSSALGSHSTDGKAKSVEDDGGEWVTVISKFHFVDLAGSERLKRTAAAGERVKEGISINSGLLALGNVISALGDPSRAKSNTASHVPYRDSKLTRLLQDSLGGNAHTLMIACVSPAEFNTNETVNTLKYANRARNIKNRAVVTEKEEGWDDLEWLQNTVSRLRKEMKSLKDGVVPSGRSAGDHVEIEGASKKVLAQMVELQSNYEDLRGKFVDRTEELTRLRRELGEKHRNSGTGTISGTAKYEEIVGPVIEEYEKTISAMEAELSLNRAALRHTNDLVEEKDEELSQLAERHSATELYVEELKSRVGKLAEREASTEAYIRDLEEKIKQQEDNSMTSSESVSDLRREISRFKDTEGRSTHYIAELEARLTRSDESILNLRSQIEKLERESDAKREEVNILQARLDDILSDGESWRSDLEKREKRVRDLEVKMEEWQARKKEASEDRARLGDINDEVQHARRSLELDIAQSVKPVKAEHTDSIKPEDELNDTKGEDSLSHQLTTLRETHAATLTDLSSVTSKYRDALKEISDLAGQINEIKLGSPSSRSESPERAFETPPAVTRRRAGTRTREPSDNEVNAAGRKLFFRQAASAESLRSRSQSQSQSLSQELFSARSRMLSSPENNGTSVPFINGHANRHSPGGFRPNLSISLPIGPGHERSVSSLEKEIMRLQEVLKERETEITTLESTLRQKERETEYHGDRNMANGHRSSGESNLSPKIKNQIDAIRKSMEIRNVPSDLAADNETLDSLNELMLSMAQKEAQHREEVDVLNDELSKVRRAHDDLTKLSRDQTHNMSTELEALRGEHSEVHAELEALQQREVHLLEERKLLEEKHENDLEQLRAEHDQALRDKQAEVDVLLEGVKAEHEQAMHVKQAEVNALLEGTKSDRDQSLAAEQAGATAMLEDAKSKHMQALRERQAEMDSLLMNVKSEHDAKLADLNRQLADASDALSKRQRDHEEAFGTLKVEHEEELCKVKEEVDAALVRATEEHNAKVAKITSEHAIAIKEKEDILHRTEEEYYTALSKLRSDHLEALAKKDAESLAATERLKEEHVGALKMAELAREGSLTESQSHQADLLKQLQSEHASAVEKKEAAFAEDLQRARDEHAAVLEKKQVDHAASVERLKSKQAARILELEESKNLEIEALQKTLASVQDQHELSKASIMKEKEDALQKLQLDHAEVLSEFERSHAEAFSKLKEEHQTSFAQADTAHQERLRKVQQQHAEVLSELEKSHEETFAKLKGELESSQSLKGELEASQSQTEALHKLSEAAHKQALDALFKEKTEEILKLKAEHQQALAELENSNLAALDQHRQDLENTRGQSEAVLSQERDRLARALAEAEAEFTKERETLRKDNALLLEDVASYKAVAEEYGSTQEETRQAHSNALQEKDKVIASLQENAEAAQLERLRFESELEQLRNELDKSRSDRKQRDQIAEELDRHRSLLSETQTELQKTKENRDALLSERTKQETLVRELQAQLVRAPQPDSHPPTRPAQDRSTSYARANGTTKLPPLTPPPSVPPPPAPKSIPPLPSAGPIEATNSVSSQSNTLRSSASSRESNLDSPATSTAGASTHAVDPKFVSQLEEQAKHIEEQEVMIKTLNKQLTHCESDLQAHMDLVSTLETSLGDSEKNLRKARMQATELARERDTLNLQIERLRNELDDSRREVTAVRRSVVEEKQSLESRLDEERRAKERVRQQLDLRVDELQKRKSKFACL